MKNLKDYIVSENNFFKNLGVGQVSLIKKWLSENYIRNYIINDDMTIDVNEDVDIYQYKDNELPDYIQFGTINGDFTISKSNISTLRGCPHTVNGWFYCQDNNNLKNLDYGPTHTHSYCVSRCSNIETLRGIASVVYHPVRSDKGWIHIGECHGLKHFDAKVEKLQNITIWNCKNILDFEDSELSQYSYIIKLEDCPLLNSIVGIPKVIYDKLSIKNCKSLKSLSGVKTVRSLISIGNGKMFKPQDFEDVGASLSIKRISRK